MNAHTPGPWKTKGPSKYMPSISDGGDYGILNADGDIIAEAICRVGVNKYCPAEQNAFLIAAAPDMYAALKAIADRDIAYMNGRVMGDQIEMRCVEQARAAIAKAEGKS